jgi:hypothetical protein
MALTLAELKEKIVQEYDNDPCELLDLLKIEVEDLLEQFEDNLIANRDKFSFLEIGMEDEDTAD